MSTADRAAEYEEGMRSLREVSQGLRQLTKMRGIPKPVSDMIEIMANTMSGLVMRFERHAPAPKLHFQDTMLVEKKP